MGTLGSIGAGASSAGKQAAKPPPPNFGAAITQGAQQGSAPQSFGQAVSQGAQQGAQQAQNNNAISAAAQSAQATAVKQSQAYAKAVADVFAAQSTAQKQAIIGGLLRQGAHSDPWTFNALRAVGGTLSGAGTGLGRGSVWANVDKIAGGLGPALGLSSPTDLLNARWAPGALTGKVPQPGSDAAL